MNSSAFEKILLPAMLTSCAMFSVLMVGFIPRRAEPITIDLPDRIESTEDINHRDVVIRHIGMSIVVSVGTGITTAELIRKWGRSREAALEEGQGFNAQAMLQAVAMPNLVLSGDGTASLSGMTEAGRVPSGPLEFHKQAISVLEPDRVDWEQPALPLFLFQPSVSLPTEDVDWFLPIQTGSTVLEASPKLRLQVADQQSAPQPLLAAHEQYQTCRITLPDAPERVLAIFLGGQYYRFVKRVVDRNQAFRLVERLDQRGEPAIITETDEHYAVWALAPEACSEPTAFIGADA